MHKPVNDFGRQKQQRNRQMSTRICFSIAGMLLGSWAPLIPLVKLKHDLNEGSLGLLLLSVGLGSLVFMPLTGTLTSRFGCRSVIVPSVGAIIILLPALTVINSIPVLAIALFIFGMAMGLMSVTMNIQASIVERQGGSTMMSGFHGMFSLGGIVGSSGISGLLALSVPPAYAAAATSVIAALLITRASSGLLPFGNESDEKAPLFVLPKGVVALLGLLGMICFLVESAVLDWSGIYLLSKLGADVSMAGLGYAFFAVAMTAGRLSGDYVRSSLGDVRVLALGGIIATAGLLTTLLAASAYVGLAGYLLIGMGLANMAPVIFTLAGKNRLMSAAFAIAAVSTIGNVGVLAGPALIGIVAHYSDLRVPFAILCLGMIFVVMSARFIRSHPDIDLAK